MGGQGQHSRSRHAARPSSRTGLALALALGVAAVGLVGFGIGRAGTADEPSGVPARPAPAASRASEPALPGPPTLLGQVTRVAAGNEIMVRIGEREEAVRILGLATPSLGAAPGSGPECGAREAVEYADARLTNQTVTLVPDATLPERGERGTRLAYVVLRSQQNYTDAALVDGVGRADTSLPLWYADVFTRDQATAVGARRGMWGPPCNARP